MHELQYLWRSGSVVGALGVSCPQHVGSSQTRDQIRVPCIGKRILNHWTTREVSPSVPSKVLTLLFEPLLLFSLLLLQGPTALSKRDARHPY